MNHIAANGFPNLANQPPPSTLAAQLVDNISTPAARSSHPDETNELKRLFAVIERIKNQPDLVKTDREKIEHNHILIYVYTRVVLEGLQWDDPIAKNAELVSEASKAFNFLLVTINETPTVLTYIADDKAFLFRGREPLWLWLLPRVLRMLGSEPCLPLTSAIEHLCCSLVHLASHLSSLWELGPQILLYLQANFGIVEARLRDTDARLSEDGSPFELQLVLDPYLRTFNLADQVSQRRCSYSLSSLEQAVRHMTSLVRILKGVVQPDAASSGTVQVSSGSIASFDNHVVWLLDSLVSLNQVLLRYQGVVDVSSLAAVDMCSQLIDILPCKGNSTGVSEMIRQKMYNVLVILCSGVADASGELYDTDSRGSESRYIFSSALVKLARGALASKPISRTIKAQLLWPLKTLTLEHHILGPESDLWVCRSHLLRAELPLHRQADSALALTCLARRCH
jgi:serine/threonine-protein kinase ATR